MDETGDATLSAAWHQAAANDDACAALTQLHRLVADVVRRERPLCLASGRCCHFEAFGHRLYVTGFEAAVCVRSLRGRGGPEATKASLAAAMDRGDCPFLLDDRLCGAHLERPLGCRIFFCDRSASTWQQELYERTHRDLVAIHERFAIPYRYGEWRAMLAMVL